MIYTEHASLLVFATYAFSLVVSCWMTKPLCMRCFYSVCCVNQSNTSVLNECVRDEYKSSSDQYWLHLRVKRARERLYVYERLSGWYEVVRLYKCTRAATFVHIRQFIYSTNGGGEATVSETQDGIMMSLMEFRSLMFQLRALDLQFTQRVETTSVVQESAEQKVDQTKSVGMKRTWDEC